MNLKYIFSIFILYGKDLLSIKVTKVIFSLLICQSILLILGKEDKKIYKETDFNPDNILEKEKNSNCEILKSSISHLRSSTYSPKIELRNLPIEKHFSNIASLKLPYFLASIEMVDVFKGNLEFLSPVSYINSLENKLYIKKSSLILDSSNRKSASLYIEGLLEISLSCGLPNNNTLPLVSKKNNSIIKLPFKTSLFLNFSKALDGDKIYFNENNIKLKKISFLQDIMPTKKVPLEDSFYLLKDFRVSLICNYFLELYQYF